MEQKTVKDQRGRKQPADTAREGGAAYAPHDEGEKAQRNRTTQSPESGDNRTPDKTIGEIKYAKGEPGNGKP
jgi:hypothetical protein